MSKFKTFLFMFSGTLLAGCAIGVFLTPNKIVAGGVSGLSTILYHMFSIPLGVSYFILNILFLLVGFKVLGKAFTMKTLLGTLLLSVFAEIFSHLPFYTENTIIPVIYGGALFGIGIGINFAAGASTGGTDILGRLLQYKFKTLPIGRLLLAADGIIILISLVAFKNFELALFGTLSLFISSYVVDFVIGQFNVSKIAFVITEKGEEIAQKLISSSTRGVTIVDVVGAYNKNTKQMLFCALKEKETEAFQKKILLIDESAFIVFSESQRIKGKGFYLYK